MLLATMVLISFGASAVFELAAMPPPELVAIFSAMVTLVSVAGQIVSMPPPVTA